MSRKIPYEFDPDIRFPSYFIRNRLLRVLRVLAPRLQGRILDFGCGSKPYRSLFETDNYTGLDFENPGHSHKNENVDVYYDGRKIPFENESFDSIFSTEVFEHIFNLEEILPELNRVLRPGGLILVTCPFAICEHESPNDFARYSSYGLKHLMEKNGFVTEEFRKTGNSVETVFQLWMMYIHQHITPWFRKVPVVRSVFRFMVYTSLNLCGRLFSRILPERKDLYLNNVILCRKIKR